MLLLPLYVLWRAGTMPNTLSYAHTHTYANTYANTYADTQSVP